MSSKSVIISLLLLLTLPLSAQTGRVTVKGRVTDAEGEALQAITVYEDGRLTNGTVTDENGRYTLTVPKGAVIVFSSLGYLDARKKVNSEGTVDITMNEDREALWEVLTDNSWNPEYNLLIHNGEKFGDLIGGEDDNWNEHLDPQLTADLHLIMQFHTLWEHSGFAITDLIYCRDFNSEFEIDYSEYNILSGK